MLVGLLTTSNFTKSINTSAPLKLNYRIVLKKQPVGTSQIHLRAIMGNMDMLMSRVNKLKDYELKLNVNGIDQEPVSWSMQLPY